MSLTMYQASVPQFQKHLNALDGLLDKAAAYAAAKKIDPSVLLEARLYPDMYSFTRQVQAATDFAKAASTRLARLAVPSFADTETTIDELKARIVKTQKLLSSIKPEEMSGAETIEIKLKVGPNDMTFSGADYLVSFALPNFYFHCATAYAILRHNGIEIGKRDFMRRVS